MSSAMYLYVPQPKHMPEIRDQLIADGIEYEIGSGYLNTKTGETSFTYQGVRIKGIKVEPPAEPGGRFLLTHDGRELTPAIVQELVNTAHPNN